jgi:hypothetical protein
MKRRYIPAPQAARDLVDFWRYLKKESSQGKLSTAWNPSSTASLFIFQILEA